MILIDKFSFSYISENHGFDDRNHRVLRDRYYWSNPQIQIMWAVSEALIFVIEHEHVQISRSVYAT